MALRTGRLTIKWGNKMKRWLRVGLVATAIAVPALSGVARADGCSNATLKGEYAFGATVLTTPQVVAGIKVFDGNGNLTQRDYQGNATPAEFSPPGQERGTYTVNRDCTGSMVINLNPPGAPANQPGVIEILLVISNGGRHIHEVVSQFTPPFSSTPTPVQTSADDWMVAPAQDQDN
jgi:hypothetical protein